MTGLYRPLEVLADFCSQPHGLAHLDHSTILSLGNFEVSKPVILPTVSAVEPEVELGFMFEIVLFSGNSVLRRFRT